MEGRKNVFIRMVECHAGLEIAPYISSAMRRETLFSTSQKPRTDDDRGERWVVGGERPALPFPSTFWSELNWMSTCTRVPLRRRRRSGNSGSSLWAFFPLCSCLFFSYYPRRTSPYSPVSSLHPPRRARSWVLYISVPSFIFSGPDYTVKDRYSGGKTYRKIFFSRKKKPKEKIYRKKKKYIFQFSL